MTDAKINIGYWGEMAEMPSPESLEVDQQEISRMERTASGRMVKDVVATKKVIDIKYVALEAEHYSHYLRLYEAGKAVKVEYTESGAPQSLDMYITSMPRNIVTYNTDYVRDVQITLEEV